MYDIQIHMSFPYGQSMGDYTSTEKLLTINSHKLFLPRVYTQRRANDETKRPANNICVLYAFDNHPHELYFNILNYSY